eukprot:2357521-Prymnesium_polylepis.1
MTITFSSAEVMSFKNFRDTELKRKHNIGMPGLLQNIRERWLVINDTYAPLRPIKKKRSE